MSGATPGQILYVALGTPYALVSGTTYAIVSSEVNNGDEWYDENTVATANSNITAQGSYYATGANTALIRGTSGNAIYIPCDALFTAP